MAYIRLLVCVGILLSLFSCQHTSSYSSYPTTMLRAEQLMDLAPDSAKNLLLRLKDSIQQQSEEVQMYYHLLTVKANDKCYVPHTGDSLMKALVYYYEQRGTPAQRMEAYYYLGSVYRDMHDAPRALNYFLQAVDASEDGKEYQILARTYAQMGTLYMYQKLYDEAIPMHKKAYHYYSLAKDSLLLSYALRDIGRAFMAQHNVDSTLFYYEAGYQIAKQMNDIRRMSAIQGELSDVYLQLGRYEEARTALTQSSAYLSNSNIASNKLIWGELYEETGQLDSAKIYYHNAIEMGSVYAKRSAYWKLYQIERDNSSYQKAIGYMDQYLIYQDSVQRITDIESVERVQSLYDYTHIKKENAELTLANAKHKAYFYQIMIICLLLVTLGIFGYYYDRSKKQRLIEQERKLRVLKDEQYAMSLERIKQNNDALSLLKEQLALAHKQEDLAKEELLNLRRQVLEEKNNRISAFHTEREALVNAFHRSEIYGIVQQKSMEPDSKLTKDDWERLQVELDATYDDFTSRLYALYPRFSEIEIRVCYLIKMYISASDIAHLVVRQKSSITSIRERLYKKIHGTPGLSKELDSFIVEF